MEQGDAVGDSSRGNGPLLALYFVPVESGLIPIEMTKFHTIMLYINPRMCIGGCSKNVNGTVIG